LSPNEYHIVAIKSFEFKRVSARIPEKHGSLFSGFSFETNVGLYDEFYPGLGQTFSQCVPILHLENYSKVTGRNIVSINRIGFGRVELVNQMRDYLMAIQIKIYPSAGTATLFAS
jgi:hypothetical protein